MRIKICLYWKINCMLKPNDREYAMSTCLIFIEGLEARKEVV
mgnify:CR=1 FL=1